MNSDKNFKNPIRLTTHACERARQRYRWNSETLNRMALRAFEQGLKRNNTKGHLKVYLDESWERHQRVSHFRLYGEIIFVFCHDSLVTLWPLPSQLRSLAKAIRTKQHERSASA
jgi:hypothetical protein